MTLPGLLAAPRRSPLRVGLGAAVILLLLGLGIAVLVTATGSHGTTTALGAGATAGPDSGASPGATSSADDAAGATVYVHVVGAVVHPGLFPLRDGDRVVDAVAAAGGFSDTADQTQVNLARFVTDGEQLSVPVIGAVVSAPGAAGGAGGAAAPGAKVNLNTADLALLDTLPQVGPAMAKRIVDWRTANGNFTSIEDLKSVTGVGDKTFAELKDLVTV
jgi:competence protein ComEA